MTDHRLDYSFGCTVCVSRAWITSPALESATARGGVSLADRPVQAHVYEMMLRRSLAYATLATAIAIAAAVPVLAQSSATATTDQQQGSPLRVVDATGYGTAYVEPGSSNGNPLPRLVDVPGYGTVVVVSEGRRDTRSQRQRCVDEQIASEGGNPSDLAMHLIDLKCSQR